LSSILIFTILILPIHEHGIFLHLLVSSLISFTSVLSFSVYRSLVSLFFFLLFIYFFLWLYHFIYLFIFVVFSFFLFFFFFVLQTGNRRVVNERNFSKVTQKINCRSDKCSYRSKGLACIIQPNLCHYSLILGNHIIRTTALLY